MSQGEFFFGTQMVSESLRYMAAEWVAWAVVDTFPETQLLSSGLTPFGFYYDFLPVHAFDQESLPEIEKAVAALRQKGISIAFREMMRGNAAEFFTYRGQRIKARRLGSVSDTVVSLLSFGDEFFDETPPATLSTFEPSVCLRLTEVERKSLWDEKLGKVEGVRLSGVVAEGRGELKALLKAMAQAKKQFFPLVASPLGLGGMHSVGERPRWRWSSRGSAVCQSLGRWLEKELERQGFEPLVTSSFLPRPLAPLRGEESKVASFRFQGEEVGLLSSRQPFHLLAFRARSPEIFFPVKYCERFQGILPKIADSLFGGEGTSLETSSFCLEEQLAGELISSLQFIDKMIRILNFERRSLLISQQRKCSSSSSWGKGLSSLQRALEQCGWEVEERRVNGPLPGPRLEVAFVDGWGRENPGMVLSVDVSLTDKLGLDSQEGEGSRPFLVQSALAGSVEQLVALKVEETSGRLPFWLAPEQLRVIPVGDEEVAYAAEVASALRAGGLRVTVDGRAEPPLKAKVFLAERWLVPYLVVVGKRERQQGTVSLRECDKRTTVSEMLLESLLTRCQEESFLAPKR